MMSWQCPHLQERHDCAPDPPRAGDHRTRFGEEVCVAEAVRCTREYGCNKHWPRDSRFWARPFNPYFATLTPLDASRAAREALCSLAHDPGVMNVMIFTDLRFKELSEVEARSLDTAEWHCDRVRPLPPSERLRRP
jgi:hypothetical protein